MSVWRAKVRLNKLSSDWQIARALLEDEYKAYIDKALDKIRTRYEFVAHVLDVHRMCCSACTHTGFLAVRRSDRDAAVGGSASAGSVTVTVSQSGQHDRKMHVSASTQTTDGLHSDAPDMGLHAGLRDNNGMDNNIRETAFPLVMTCHGELQADASTASTEKPPNERVIKQEYDESSQEKDEEQGEEDTDEGWIDDGRLSSLQDQIPETHQHLHVADVQSNLENANEFSDLLITQEGLSKEYCDVDMESSRNQSTSHQGHEEGIPAQHIRSDVQSHLERTNEFSYLLIKEEGPCQEYCDVDMDSSRNESTSQQRHEEGIPTQHIRPDGKTLMTSNNEASTSTLHYDEHSPEGSSQDLCDADGKTILENIKKVSRTMRNMNERTHEGLSQDLCDADGKRIIHSNNEPSSSTMHNDERIHLGSSQNICDAGMDINKKVQNTDRKQSVKFANHKKRLSCMSSCNKNLSNHPCQEMYRRSECEERFDRRGHQKSHIIRTHTGGKPHQCIVCDKTFTTRSHLSRHMRLHTGDKPHQCSICNKAFTTSSDLSDHVRTHTGEKPYQCSVCSKAFPSSSNLSRHLRYHTGEKPYQCSECEKKFAQKHHLKSHARTHTGEKPVPCSICRKNFSQNTDMNRHMRTHTGEKPYQCPSCDKRFSQKNNLSLHVRTHTGEKPYQCSVCNKACTNNIKLSSHMRTHTGEKPFSCAISPNRDINFKRHERTHTGEKPY